LSSCPRSWLATKALACLGDRLAHLLPRRPPRARDTPPLAFKVRLDAMTTVVLDGLPYVRVGRAVGSSTSRFASACTCWARWPRSGTAGPRHLHRRPRRAWRSLGGDSQSANRRPTGSTREATLRSSAQGLSNHKSLRRQAPRPHRPDLAVPHPWRSVAESARSRSTRPLGETADRLTPPSTAHGNHQLPRSSVIAALAASDQPGNDLRLEC
jgi:hypothetical protein